MAGNAKGPRELALKAQMDARFAGQKEQVVDEVAIQDAQVAEIEVATERLDKLKDFAMATKTLSAQDVADFVWRCETTSNPVGTDTRMIGEAACPCRGCRGATLERQLAEAQAEIERLRKLETAFMRVDLKHV